MDWESVLDTIETETGIDGVKLCTEWLDGQASAMYKVSCNGKLLSREHADDLASEVRACVRLTHNKKGSKREYERLSDFLIALDEILDSCPEVE